MSLGLPAGITTAMAAAAVAAYVLAWFGIVLQPWLVGALGVLAGAVATWFAEAAERPGERQRFVSGLGAPGRRGLCAADLADVATPAAARRRLGSHPPPDAGRRHRADEAPSGRRVRRGRARRNGSLHAGPASADRNRRRDRGGRRLSRRVPTNCAHHRAEGRLRAPDRLRPARRHRRPTAACAGRCGSHAVRAAGLQSRRLPAGGLLRTSGVRTVRAGRLVGARALVACPLHELDGLCRAHGGGGIRRVADLAGAVDGRRGAGRSGRLAASRGGRAPGWPRLPSFCPLPSPRSISRGTPRGCAWPEPAVR